MKEKHSCGKKTATKKAAIVVLITLLVLASGVTLAGCDYEHNENCPRSGECDAIIYCGQSGCAGYYGGTCNCD